MSVIDSTQTFWIVLHDTHTLDTHSIRQGKFTFDLDQEYLKSYEAIDGFYVITTDVTGSEMMTGEVRDRYKSLSQVEQAFRSLKTTDLFMRPVRHWNPQRVKGHIFAHIKKD